MSVFGSIGEMQKKRMIDEAYRRAANQNAVNQVMQANTPSGFAMGLRDPLDAAAQIVERSVPEPVRRGINAANDWLVDRGVPLQRMGEAGLQGQLNALERRYQASRENGDGIDWERMAGGMVSGAALPAGAALKATSLLGRVGASAGAGAVGGLMGAPITGQDFSWSQKGAEALTGAAMGSGQRVASELYQNPAVREMTRDALRRVKGSERIERWLTDQEVDELSAQGARGILGAMERGNTPDELAAAALAGSAKKGWYQDSERAMRQLFDNPNAPDDPERFVALLAATSPQTSVQGNLTNALKAWTNWDAAGRPKDRDSMMQIFRRSWGDASADKMEAWTKNAMRALSAKDAREIRISGPKVESFRRNLLGDLEQATNDAWMANLGGASQEKLFTSRDNVAKDWVGKVYTPAGGYLAQAIKTRQAAEGLGPEWAAANVQEAGWSLGKTLMELATKPSAVRKAIEEFGNEVPDYIQNMQAGDYSVRGLLESGLLEDTPIIATPAFGDILQQERYSSLLAPRYRERVATLPTTQQIVSTPYERIGLGPTELASAPVGQNLLNVADTLDRVIAARRAGTNFRSALSKMEKKYGAPWDMMEPSHEDLLTLMRKATDVQRAHQGMPYLDPKQHKKIGVPATRGLLEGLDLMQSGGLW